MIKKLILKLKYYHKKDTGLFLGKRLANILRVNPYIDVDNTIFSYVPSHWIRRYFIKGYNQSQILAKFTSYDLGIGYTSICHKPKSTKSQAKLSREQRLHNLEDSFAIVDDIKLEGIKNIIIIDDVTTTGATINNMAKSIKSKFPDKKIWGLVIARNNK